LQASRLKKPLKPSACPRRLSSATGESPALGFAVNFLAWIDATDETRSSVSPLKRAQVPAREIGARQPSGSCVFRQSCLGPSVSQTFSPAISVVLSQVTGVTNYGRNSKSPDLLVPEDARICDLTLLVLHIIVTVCR